MRTAKTMTELLQMLQSEHPGAVFDSTYDGPLIESLITARVKEAIESDRQAIREALQGILDDDSRYVSLETQHKRWDQRMASAREALALLDAPEASSGDALAGTSNA